MVLHWQSTSQHLAYIPYASVPCYSDDTTSNSQTNTIHFQTFCLNLLFCQSWTKRNLQCSHASHSWHQSAMFLCSTLYYTCSIHVDILHKRIAHWAWLPKIVCFPLWSLEYLPVRGLLLSWLVPLSDFSPSSFLPRFHLFRHVQKHRLCHCLWLKLKQLCHCVMERCNRWTWKLLTMTRHEQKQEKDAEYKGHQSCIHYVVLGTQSLK